MNLFPTFRSRRCAPLFLAALLFLSFAAQSVCAQAAESKPDPATDLADALAAACRQDQTAFATYLTTENSAAFRALPSQQRTALIKRFVLLEDPGKPLLTTTSDGHPVMRCTAAGVTSEMRFGPSLVHDNLAFIRVEVPQAGQADEEGVQNARFGLVRENGEWKLLSIGLLLLDIPALQKQWEHADLTASESDAIAALRKISAALKTYQAAYGKLPEDIGDLASPSDGSGLSPEKAGLLDNQLATGESGAYRFRYAIVPGSNAADDSERDKTAGFSLAATPIEYGKGGKRSFYLDSNDNLQGGDKHGAVATADDPQIGADPQQ